MFEPRLNERQSRLDWLMLVAAGGLMILGAAFIYSAAAPHEASAAPAWYKAFHNRQIIYYILGIAVAAGFLILDYHAVARWSLVLYWFSILLLVAVLIEPIGAFRGGARRWIDLGPIQMQPSEFAKLAVILVQAHFLSRPVGELRLPGVFLKSLGLTLLPFLLILKEPDLGSALVLLPVTLVMLYVAGAPRLYLNWLVGGAALLVALIVVDILFAPKNWRIPIEDYQRHRLLVWFGRDFAEPGATPQERRRARQLQDRQSYNVKQALISVGSGGLTGKGWKEGTQNALGYLPRGVAHNDFIFSVLAEEKGFLGSATVIALYTVLIFSAIRVASQARDRLGKLLVVGVVSLLFTHIFVNIGMNIRLMPVTGIPLPLLSYGGSSVLCSLLAIGMAQNVYFHRRTY